MIGKQDLFYTQVQFQEVKLMVSHGKIKTNSLLVEMIMLNFGKKEKANKENLMIRKK
jgi:hypothetical protein